MTRESLSREDVILGRAVLAWRLVPREQLLACSDEVRRLAAAGQRVPLAKVLVARGLLSPERYQAIVARLRQVYRGQPAPPHLREAALQVPQVSQSGSYYAVGNTPPLPPQAQVDDSGVRRAVAGWHKASGEILAKGSDIHPPADASPVPPGSAGGLPSLLSSGLLRPDGAIRERLGVPAEAERFPIGAWQVQRFVGAGAWGVVYQVTRDGSPKRFALKVLKDTQAPEEILQRFVQEALTLSKLAHPGIVRIHDAARQQGVPYLVMDFLEGRTLKQLFAERPLPPARVLELLAQLCEAVAHAHSRGVLHRDLKPENVVILTSGQPVLTDFGLAKDHTAGVNLTAEGARIGTPLYMAPEILIKNKKPSPRSEVYALGAILYEGLTGRVPFPAADLWALSEQVEQTELVPPARLRPGIPPALDELCQRALARDAARRPITVAKFARELRELGRA